MATTKAKSTKKPAAKKVAAKKPAPKSKTTAKAAKVAPKAAAVKATKVGAVKTKIVSEKKNPVKEFFARKGDPNENILTIFKDTKIIGALIGEIVGTGLVTAVALTLGLFNPLYLIFAYIGITAAVFALSGAHINPIITAGMMASRRVSAIRGVLYLIAQLLGAWLGFMLISYFYNQGFCRQRQGCRGRLQLLLGDYDDRVHRRNHHCVLLRSCARVQARCIHLRSSRWWWRFPRCPLRSGYHRPVPRYPRQRIHL